MPAMTIFPYLYEGACWVFDDPRAGLKEEAFVLGASEMISRVVEMKAIPQASRGFTLRFSAEPFDHDVQLTWLSPADAAQRRSCSLEDLPGIGNWYAGRVFGQEMTCWLCPALFCYFDQAPEHIYVKAEPLPSGVDPIWHVDAHDPRATRFVAPAGETDQSIPS
jgi:hypothetical protein